jgi:hypothetical protein
MFNSKYELLILSLRYVRNYGLGSGTFPISPTLKDGFAGHNVVEWEE